MRSVGGVTSNGGANKKKPQKKSTEVGVLGEKAIKQAGVQGGKKVFPEPRPKVGGGGK